MKVAITASGEDLNSPVDRVFGRARYFVITDPEETNVEVLENSQNVNAAQGAGIQAARQMANKSVNVILTGNVGPNAFRALEAVSIRVFQFGKRHPDGPRCADRMEGGALAGSEGAYCQGTWVLNGELNP